MRTTHHAPRTTHHAPRTTHHAPRTTYHVPRTTYHAPRTTYHAPRTTHVYISGPMAPQASFDISTGADLQEVDNAVNQASKEVAQRYDFKGSKCAIAFDRAKATLSLTADDDFRMKALFDVLQGNLVKPGVSLKNLELADD